MDELLTLDESQQLSIEAGKVFQPQTPIKTRELLAGRWEQLIRINDAVHQTGLHVLIYGERGVGKTSCANVIDSLLHVMDHPDADLETAKRRLVVKVNAIKEDTFSSVWHRAFESVPAEAVAPAFGFASNQLVVAGDVREPLNLPRELNAENVRRALSHFPESVFIIDEFDRIPRIHKEPFTDLIKSMSDNSVDSTIVLVGVSRTVDELITDHASIGRALIQIKMPRLEASALKEILTHAAKTLQITLDDDAASHIVKMSQGLPHYTHLVGQNSVRCACKAYRRHVTLEHAKCGFKRAVENAEELVRSQYVKATQSPHPDSTHAEILLSCAIAAHRTWEEGGYFQPAAVCEPFTFISRKSRNVSSFNRHLTEFAESSQRGGVLEREGVARRFKYRFKEPLMPTYVIARGIASGVIDEEDLERLITLPI